MNPEQPLRATVLAILAQYGPLGIGALLEELQQAGHTDLQGVLKLLDQLREEGEARVDGPPARRTWNLARATAAGPRVSPPPLPPRPAAAPLRQNVAPPSRQAAVAPDDFDELEDPSIFLHATPAPPKPVVATPAPPVPVVATPAPPVPVVATPAPQPPAPQPRAPRTTRYKSLTRCDYPAKSMVGYMVRVNWCGQRQQAFFSDAKHGDRLGSLAAALEWRDRVERDLGKPRTEQLIIGVAASNTGIPGVTRLMRDGHPAFQVSWYENGRMRRTSISIDKHGEAEALQKAREIRERIEREGLARAALVSIKRPRTRKRV